MIFLPFYARPNVYKDSALYEDGGNKPSTMKVLVGNQFQRLKNWNHNSLQCGEVGLPHEAASNGKAWSTGLRPFPRPAGFPGPRWLMRLETRWDLSPEAGPVKSRLLIHPKYLLIIIVEIEPERETLFVTHCAARLRPLVEKDGFCWKEKSGG